MAEPPRSAIGGEFERGTQIGVDRLVGEPLDHPDGDRCVLGDRPGELFGGPGELGRLDDPVDQTDVAPQPRRRNPREQQLERLGGTDDPGQVIGTAVTGVSPTFT